MPHSGVQLKLDRSGGVTAFCGATEIGQGSDDVLVALRGRGARHRSDRHPRGHRRHRSRRRSTSARYSSRVTLMMGNAAIQAAERARDLLAEAVVDEARRCRRTRLVFAERRVFDAERSRARASTFAEAVQLAEAMFGTHRHDGSLHAAALGRDATRAAASGPRPTYSYSAAVVEVEVDPTTGWIHVPKVWIAHDIGRALNPMLVRGQVEGSVYMALGEALMEEQAFRRLPPRLSHALVHKFPSMLEYKSPTTLDMPEVDDRAWSRIPIRDGPFGAKEVGQGPLLPVMPAVANAVYDAVGVRIDEVPITPEKILKALEREGRGKPARFGPTRFPDVPWPEPLRGAAAVGRRRRQAATSRATRQAEARQTGARHASRRPVEVPS